MAVYLGLDTSNYTTSAALYDTAQDAVMQAKQLLPVRPGEKGLRQSDAVFHHTVQLPGVLSRLTLPEHLAGIGVSVRPRNAEGSYMPCFLCGEGAADMLGQALHVPVYRTSHQIGHILAALYSAKAESLLHAPFLAFHVSGGTTDCVLCEPDAETLLRITPVGTSLDLKAGQAVDRVGVMLGLSFPCGQALEALAVKSTRRFTYRPTMKGCDCCLSGLENQCRRQLEDGMPPEDIAAGWALGVFVGCAVPFGLQLVISIPLALMMRVSKIGATLGTFVTNPVTIFFIYPAQTFVVNRLLFGGSLTYARLAATEWTWAAVRRLGADVMASFFLGGFLLAIVMTPLAYFAVYRIVVRARARRARRGRAA